MVEGVLGGFAVVRGAMQRAGAPGRRAVCCAVLLVALLAGVALLPALGPVDQYRTLVGIELASVIAMAVGMAPENRRESGWWLLVAGVLVFAAANLLFLVMPAGDEAFNHSAYGVEFLGYALVIGGFLLLLRPSMGLVIDLAIGALVATYPVIVLGDALILDGVRDHDVALMQVCFLELDIVIVVLPLVTLVTAHATRRLAFGLVALAGIVYFAADLRYAVDAGGGDGTASTAAMVLWGVTPVALVASSFFGRGIRQRRTLRFSALAIVPALVGAVAWIASTAIAFNRSSENPRIAAWSAVSIGAAILVAVSARYAYGLVQDARRARAEELASAAGRFAVRYGTQALLSSAAHDFSNVAWSLNMAARSGLRAAAAGEDPTEDLQEVLGAVEVAQRVITRLRAVDSTVPATRPEPVYVASVVGALLPIVRLRAGEHRHLEVDVRAQPGAAIDRGDLEQAVLNLTTNALLAAGECGHVRVIVDADDRRALVSVEDDGPGVPPELRERIFDPFFTTRDQAGGQGLGLAIAVNAVEAAGGTLTLDSPQDPTRFTIALPRCDASPAAPAADAAALDAPTQEVTAR